MVAFSSAHAHASTDLKQTAAASFAAAAADAYILAAGPGSADTGTISAGRGWGSRGGVIRVRGGGSSSKGGGGWARPEVVPEGLEERAEGRLERG